jgi:hypothetical protein
MARSGKSFWFIIIAAAVDFCASAVCIFRRAAPPGSIPSRLILPDWGTQESIFEPQTCNRLACPPA